MYKLLKMLMAGLMLGLLFHSSHLNLSLLWLVLKSPVGFFGIIVLLYAMAFANSWRWKILNDAQKVILQFKSTFLLTYVSIAYNTVLPGNVGGDVVRLFHAGKLIPGKKSELLVTTILDRLVALVGLFAVFLGALPFYVGLFNRSTPFPVYSLNSTLFFSVTFFLVIFSCVFYFIAKKYKIYKVLHKVRRVKSVNRLLSSLHVCAYNKFSLFLSLCVSILTQLFILLVIVVISSIMNLPHVSIADFAFALVFAQLASLLPISPGGIGVGEAAFSNTILLLNPGVVGEYATVFLALRLLTALAFLPGVFYGVYGTYSSPLSTVLGQPDEIEQQFK